VYIGQGGDEEGYDLNGRGTTLTVCLAEGGRKFGMLLSHPPFPPFFLLLFCVKLFLKLREVQGRVW
jgi:hypothetical protein